MLNYLRDYGAISFADRGLNDVDRLVFAQLAYLNFDPSLRDVPLARALAAADFGGSEPSEVRFPFQHRDDRELCRLAACARYAGILLADCMRSFDPVRERQFAAISLRLPDGAMMIVFRGTDNTLAGWKEDFNLAFLDEIPSQGMACAYVDEVARDAAAVELCGHSKGGNLALYAAVHCNEAIQAKIRDAVSFDGPGLSRRVIESDGFARVEGRLRLRIPQASLVGLLFHQPEDVREHLVEAIYSIVSTTGAETLNDLVNVWVASTPAVAKQLLRMDRKFYWMLLKILAAFWVSVAEAFGVVLKVNVDDWFREESV